MMKTPTGLLNSKRRMLQNGLMTTDKHTPTTLSKELKVRKMVIKSSLTPTAMALKLMKSTTMMEALSEKPTMMKKAGEKSQAEIKMAWKQVNTKTLMMLVN
jgi:hypothetical protein